MDRVVERSPWRRRLRWGVAVALVVAIAGFTVAGMSGERERAVDVAGDRVTIDRVTRGEFDDFIQVRGRFIPQRTTFIDTVQGGQVEAIHVDNGATVERGQLLLELSNTVLRLEVISREAQITEQLNNLRGLELAHERNRLAQDREAIEVDYQIVRLQRQVERAEPLVASGSMPRGDLEALEDELGYYRKRRRLLHETRETGDRLERAQLEQLRLAAEQLDKSLAVTRSNLDGLQVRALVAGQLTAFDLEIGQSLAPGERIGQIDDPSRFKILAEIDEFYLARVDLGQRADYQVGDTVHRLSVAKIRPQVKSGRFEVDLVFEGDGPARVHRGQTAQLRLWLGQPSPAVLVPNAAFFNDTGGAWVFVVSSDHASAVRREVRLGRRNPAYIEVIEGLVPGEEIVTSPYTRFLEMDRLDLSDRR